MMRRLSLAAFIGVAVATGAAAQIGFQSISFIWNQDSWDRMTMIGPPGPNAALESALRAPKRISFIYNAWHLPAAVKDIRTADLEAHVFGRSLMFQSRWPPHPGGGPGYVALVETSNGDFALVSEMVHFFLIEYRSTYSVVAKRPVTTK